MWKKSDCEVLGISDIEKLKFFCLESIGQKLVELLHFEVQFAS